MARLARDAAISGDEVRQAGGVVYRKNDGRTEFLVISTRGDRRSWIFPKGHVEAGEADADAALREVHEESGVTGAVVGVLEPPHRFRVAGEDFVVRYVLVCALEDGDPEEGREKRWVSAEDALVLLTHPEARKLILCAHRLVDQIPILARPPDRLPDLVVAEHHHLSRSLAQNERQTEQRVSVLVLLLVAAGVATFGLPPVAGAAVLAVVLLLGLVTFQTVVHDVRVQDGYRTALATLRRSFVSATDDPQSAVLPSDPRTLVTSFTRGGALPTVVLIDGVLAGGLAATVSPGAAVPTAVVASLLLAGVAYRR